MTQPRPLTSWLAPHFENFVALRQASGVGYVSQRKLLVRFDRYVGTHTPKPPLRSETLLKYVASLKRLTPRARDNVVAVVWPALTHARRHGARIEALPVRPSKPAARYWRQRQPRILSVEEVASILQSAHRLAPGVGLRTASLLGLLYTTGIRIGEALALDVEDLDCQHRILTIRSGKFGKSRALPLRESTAQALGRYIEHPLRAMGTEASDPIFVSSLRRRLKYTTARSGIRRACLAAEIPEPLPRPHDLRHTFAVSRVLAWYQEGRDVNALLPVLSTYLGHSCVEHTRLYLVANGALLEQASVRFAHHAKALDEVLS